MTTNIINQPIQITIRRFAFLDALRGAALLCMVVDHAYDWWLTEADNLGTWGRTTEFIGTLAAPTFLALVGVSMTLASAKRASQHISTRQAFWFLVRRGGMVFLWGFLTNFLVFFNGNNWQDVFAFDVLQCIGLGMIICAPLVLWGADWVLALITIGALWIGQNGGAISLSGYMGTMLNGNPPIAYFPLLPWLFFIPVGILWGRRLLDWQDQPARLNRMSLLMLPTGLGLAVAAALIPLDWGYRYPFTAHIFFNLAIIAWGSAILYFLSSIDWGLKSSDWLRALGKETLFLYILHHLIGYRLFYSFGAVTGHTWQGHYGIFSVGTATAMLLALMVLLYVSTRLWIMAKVEYPQLGDWL
ncbi:MAG: DUF1624 domain-containing protein [Anaerolineae bacterium]|nr:DUF1624 domain-containing protein [Anaerolineae bacterium]